MSEAGRSGRHRPLLRTFALALVLVVGAPGSSAYGHAERSTSDPEPQARLRDAPTRISIEFTEPPTGDATAQVIDGCERNLVRDVALDGTSMALELEEGQPGRWTVETHVVSAIDGHPTRDSWDFRVRGEADCSEIPDPPADDGDDPSASGDDSDEGGLPLLPIALGVGALLLMALGVRLRSSP